MHAYSLLHETHLLNKANKPQLIPLSQELRVNNHVPIIMFGFDDTIHIIGLFNVNTRQRIVEHIPSKDL